MGNATTKNYSKSISVGTSSRKARWNGPGLPAPPGKPILISGINDAQPDAVSIRWDRSTSNGGSAIVGYLVEHRRLGSTHWTRSTSALCTFPELTLSGLEPGWRYQFRVRAQNALGMSQPSEVSEPLAVTLQRTAAAASTPRFDLELKDTTALENEQAEFVVQFSGTPLPKISWFKDGFEIFSSRRTRIITDDGKSVLLIHQTAHNDEGEIKCTATNRAGHISTRGRLILEAPPRIRLPRQYEDGLLFEQDETIRLKVSMAGKPPPAVTWYHDGELVSKDARHIFETMDNESVLKIPDAKRIDRGEYSIRVKNKLGEDAASFLVTVTDRPAAPGKVTVSMTLGRSVTLSWNEPDDDGGCKIGTYIVEYYRIGWEVWLKATTSRRTTATLTELIEGSEYKFRVKAENPYGVSEPSEESDVIFIPDLKRKIVAPLSEKSQSHREISRSRGEKREANLATPAQRTRSLTREEGKKLDDVADVSQFAYGERSASAQRLATTAADRPSRADSRVTFALDTLEKDGPPIPPARSRDRDGAAKQEIPVGDCADRSGVATEARDKTQDIRRERTTSPKPVATTVVISPPAVEEEPKAPSTATRPVTRESRSLSPFSAPRAQEYQREDSRVANSSLKRQTAVVSDSTLWTPPSSPQTLPQEADENALHGSSEFMLVLYPEDETGDKDPLDVEARVDEGDGPSAFVLAEDENDLIAPPMSLSLPELFSAQHRVVEIMREAVSSTELLHERAMERFYRAIAAEEASDVAKRKTQLERQTGELAQSDVDSVQRSSLRRRLSNSGVTTQNLITSWQAKKNRRRSSEGQATDRTMKLLSPALLPDVEARSDPNLPSETTMADIWRRSNDEDSVERLRRWHETNPLLLEEAQREKSITASDEIAVTSIAMNGTDTLATPRSKENEEEERERFEESVETSEESSEEISSADSEDLRSLKSRILARQVMEEEETYHPRGRPIPHVEPEVPEIVHDRMPALEITPPPSIKVSAPVSPSNVVPKSILKKPKEAAVSAPQDGYGRSVPPEKPIRKTLSQYQDSEKMDVDAENRLPDYPSMPEILKSPAMSESDTDSIVSAAEAAKNRRIQSRMRSMSSEDEAAELEARMAVVNQYTEIVREYSNHSRGHDSAVSSRRSSISEDQDQRYRPQEATTPKPIIKKQQQQQHIDTTESKLKNNKNQAPGLNRKGGVDSRSATPVREAKEAKERHGSKPSSRDQSPAARRRDRSVERGAAGASSRSSSKTRNRTPSQDRSNRSSLRSDSSESVAVREKSIERGTRRSKVPSRPSSRSSSRSNSRERYGASVPVESKVERLQRALESNKYRATRRGSQVAREEDVDEAAGGDRDASGKQLALEAKRTVRSTVSYITDLTLLMAAMYVYFFKRETLAVPFIVLVLYRRVQEELHGWMPRRWWRRSTKKR